MRRDETSAFPAQRAVLETSRAIGGAQDRRDGPSTFAWDGLAFATLIHRESRIAVAAILNRGANRDANREHVAANRQRIAALNRDCSGIAAIRNRRSESRDRIAANRIAANRIADGHQMPMPAGSPLEGADAGPTTQIHKNANRKPNRGHVPLNRQRIAG